MKSCILKSSIVTTIILLSSAAFLPLPGAITARRSSIVYPESFTLQTLTIYNPVEAQCDGDPLVTASNKQIDKKKLRNGNIRWMALSRDLLKRWGGSLEYGDTVTVHASDSTIDGAWIIQDTMNKRFTMHGDLLFDSEKRSLGKWNNVVITRHRRLTLENITRL